MNLIEKQKLFLQLLKNDGYSFEQLTEAYNRGYIVDEVYKYGLELYGFDIFSNGLEDLAKRNI